MNLEEAVEAFRHGQFELDFASIAIAQCKAQEPLSYVGPGYIRQDSDGRLEVKCYAATTAHSGIAIFNQQMQSTSGGLYVEEDHYRCVATEQNGQTWEAGPSLLTPSVSFVTGTSVMKLAPRALVRHLGWSDEPSRLKLEFFEQPQREWSALLGVHHLELATGQTMTLTVESGADENMIATFRSASPLPAMLEMRLVESLQFVLCRDLHVDICDFARDRKRTVELRSAGGRRARVSPYPPLDTRTARHTENVVRLLQNYLNFAATTGSEDLWHPCSAHLAHARQASANSLEAWEVGLSVAVEGIANLIPAEDGADPVSYQQLRSGISAWLKERKYPDNLVQRITGMLGSLEMVRPKDRMIGLVESGVVTKGDIDAWVRVRNVSVHTRQVTTNDLADDELQRRLDQLHQVYRLMHCMVFHLIGYIGPYSNYADRGFPEADFPLGPAVE